MEKERSLPPDQKKEFGDTLEKYYLGVEGVVRGAKKTVLRKKEQDARIQDADLEKMLEQI